MLEIQVYFNPSTASKQLFSFPSDVIKYAVKGCYGSTWLKLIKSCKYFYAKFKIYEFKNVTLGNRGSVTVVGRNFNKCFEKITDVPCNLFLTGKLAINNPFSIIKPIISKCFLRHLRISKVDIVSEDFKLLTASKMLNYFQMHNSKIVYSDGKIVQLEDIFAALPYVTHFTHECTIVDPKNKFINPQTFHLMAERSRNRKLVEFELNITPDDIFAEDFVKFVENHAGNNCKIVLTCESTASRHLQNITNQMLENWKPNTSKPSIEYKNPSQTLVEYFTEQNRRRHEQNRLRYMQFRQHHLQYLQQQP